MSERRVPGWILPAGLGVLVVVLVVIALIRGPIQLDPDSPEGTVQEYLVAISEERWDEAVEFVHEDWRGSCQGVHVQAFVYSDFSAELAWDGGRGGGFSPIDEFAAVEDDPSRPLPAAQESVQVQVTIHHRDGLGSTWDEHVTFELIDDGGFWWLVGEPWPYFSWDCAVR